MFLQCWFIIPQTWVKLSLLSKSKSAGNEYYLVTYRDGDKTEQGQISLADALTGEAGITDKTWLAHYESSEDAHRTFCSRCGTNLTFFWTGEMKPGVLSSQQHVFQSCWSKMLTLSSKTIPAVWISRLVVLTKSSLLFQGCNQIDTGGGKIEFLGWSIC